MEQENNLEDDLNSRIYLQRLLPISSTYVAAGTLIAVEGLAKIVQDFASGSSINNMDKFSVSVGAGTIMYGIGFLLKAYSDYTRAPKNEKVED